MIFDSWFWFPFMAAGFGAMLILGIALFAFWIWMIVDCAKRDFRKDLEKIIWLIVAVVGGWVGALVYFILIKNSNHKGLMKR